MLRIGLSSNGFTHDDEFFSGVINAGITDIEISRSYYDELIGFNFNNVMKLSAKHGVNICSFHLPFAHDVQYCLEALDGELRKSSVEYFKDLVKRAGDVGIKNIIIHGSSEPIKQEERSEKLKFSKDGLFQLAQTAKTAGCIIAVENLPRTCLGNTSKELKDMISVDENLKVCFDFNHLLKESHYEFIKELGDKIVSTHVSDYDFVDERHWLPGEGDIKWKEVYPLFIGCGYKGVFLYEVPVTIDTLERTRPLSFDDYVLNAKEIFSGSKLTVLPTVRKV